MSNYTESFCRYIRENPLKCYGQNVESVIDFLFECYAEGGLQDTTIMRECIHKIYTLTDAKAGDEILIAFSEFANEAQKLAFREGVRTGGKWMMEILGKD